MKKVVVKGGKRRCGGKEEMAGEGEVNKSKSM